MRWLKIREVQSFVQDHTGEAGNPKTITFFFLFLLTLRWLAFCSSAMWSPSAFRRPLFPCQWLTHPHPGPWLAGALASVWQTTGEKAGPGTGQAAKLFGMGGIKPTFFWMIPILRETNANQNSLAAVCWNIWTLFPACDIIFLPDFNVKNSRQTLWTIVSFKHNMDCMYVYHWEETLCETRRADSLFQWLRGSIDLLNLH